MGRITNTKQWVDAMTILHNNRYDYGKSIYVDSKTDIIINCKIHGDFVQNPRKHALGRGCRKCANNHLLTTEDFIEKSVKIHGNKFDYSKVNVVNTNTKVCIICPEHGEFWQTPSGHYRASGCKKCKGVKITNTEEFVQKAKEIHNDKYDYSKSYFTKMNDKIEIICKIHGSFLQSVASHINGYGCRMCAGECFDTKTFISKASEIHKNKYDYSNVVYKKSDENVTIICKKHGNFEMRPTNHINGQGCPKCKCESISKKLSKTVDDFLKDMVNVHEEKYTYDMSDYKNSKSKIRAYCKKHGWFDIKASNLLRGNGCKKCYLESNIGENHPSWNPNLTDEERLLNRDVSENAKWRTNVFNRDNYTCVICGKKGDLNAHHLNGYHWDTENRFNIDNGVTMCADKSGCHKEFHKLYGNKNNTRKQFEEFYRIKTEKDFGVILNNLN